jgi:integrase
MSIHTRHLGKGQKRYDVRFRDHQGRQRKKTFPMKRQAEAFAATQRIAHAKSEWIDAHGAKVPLSQYATTWFETRAPLAPRTRDTYEGLLRLHILPYLGDRPLAQISVSVVRTWHSELVRSKSQNLAAKAYRLLSAVMQTALEDGFIVKSPCAIRGAGIERSAERPIATIDQVFALADAIGSRYRLAILLACFAGLRKGEILALKPDRFDLREQTVTIREQLQERADGTLLASHPKTGAGIRVVALPEFLVDEVWAHLDAHINAPSDLLFRGSRGGPLRRAVLHRAWALARSRLGLEHLHFHDLRHTGNTLAAATGASTRELMVRMGHASADAALRYQHATRERDRVIAAKIDTLVIDALDKRPPDGPLPPRTAGSRGDSPTNNGSRRRMVA